MENLVGFLSTSSCNRLRAADWAMLQASLFTLWPVDDRPAFAGLLAAIDRADQRRMASC